MIEAIRKNWREYLMEASLLGLFMVSAGFFTILMEYPGSPVHQMLPDGNLRRFLIGVAMGVTAITLILSPWGKRSGAHMNPAVTLAFLRLGKVRPWDALFYVIAQFAGGITGVLLVNLVAPRWLAHSAVNFVATLPGEPGPWVAFAAEFGIALVLMTAVLYLSNSPGLARWTPLFAGALVALFITIEAPFSGMSMNPARTFGSAFAGQLWMYLWIYFVAPVIAMQCAALLYQTTGRAAYCAKLHHHNNARCLFHCAFPELAAREKEMGAVLLSTSRPAGVRIKGRM